MIKNQSANMYIRKINLVCLVGLFLSARIARTIILEPSDNLQAIYEGDSVTFRCEVEKPWAVANGSCMISHLSHPKLKICQHFSNFSSNCKDFQGRSYYTSSDVMNKHLCGLTLNNVILEDRGDWKCRIRTPKTNPVVKIFHLEILPRTTTSTTTTATTAITSTTSTLAPSSAATLITNKSSTTGGVIVGAIIAPIMVLLIIVTLAYYNYISCFSFLPRKSPALRQQSDLKRSNTITKAVRRSLHTFLEFVEQKEKDSHKNHIMSDTDDYVNHI